MKITDLVIQKEEMADGQIGLSCHVTLTGGQQIASVVKWRNDLGLWASDSEEREAAEICAYLRNFAAAIERAAKEREAA